MAHFAELDSNNVVQRVVVIDNADTTDSEGNEVESIGVDFCEQLFGSGTIWKQTSYHANIRDRFAGPGYTYDESLDAFIAIKPYESWVLNPETTEWEAPVPKPELTDEEIDMFAEYVWDEESLAWVMIYPPNDEETMN